MSRLHCSINISLGHMKFRYARHTNHLKPIIEFYTTLFDFEVLDEFKDHQGYDGVFIGLPNENWHLEFTVSWEQPLHRPDEDDLLVFYPKNMNDYELIIKKMSLLNMKPSRPKNPYWRRCGTLVIDPDGFGVVFVKPEK